MGAGRRLAVLVAPVALPRAPQRHAPHPFPVIASPRRRTTQRAWVNLSITYHGSATARQTHGQARRSALGTTKQQAPLQEPPSKTLWAFWAWHHSCSRTVTVQRTQCGRRAGDQADLRQVERLVIVLVGKSLQPRRRAHLHRRVRGRALARSLLLLALLVVGSGC